MTIMNRLPNEVISLVLSHLDSQTINESISGIPQLKGLLSLTITDSPEAEFRGNVITVQEIMKRELPLDPLFKKYHFVRVNITQFKDEKIYMRTHRILARLLKLKKDIRVRYTPREIDMNYLKMFKSLFHLMPETKVGRNPHHLYFSNLKEIRCNANHLFVGPIVEYPALITMNLYYCSSKFYFQVFEYLNTERHPDTFPQLTNLKLEDYMNEEEDIYSKHSNHYIRSEEFDEDYDDYDHNSDLDENEFYFDGLEILQNYTLTNLRSLSMKNCSISKLKNIHAPNLTTLKIFELTNKHIEAFDLNLVDSEHIQTQSFLTTSVSTSCSIQKNYLPNLSTLKVIGHINLKDFSGNKLRLSKLYSVTIKGTNVEVTDKDAFWTRFSAQNELMVRV